MIDVKNVHFGYHNDQKLFSGLHFSIEQGSFTALLGANGSGKTTLIKLLLGKLKAQKGSVRVLGSDPTLRKEWHDVGYVPQNMAIDTQHPATVRELILNTKICKELFIPHLLDKQFNKLSGGQKQKVLVALALQHDPTLLVLDEPTTAMDASSRKQFYELLVHLHKHHDKTILLVTHDTHLIRMYASTLLCMDHDHEIPGARCVHG